MSTPMPLSRFMTNAQKLHKGIWPWTTGPRSRLPLYYKIKYIETFMKEPAPVHYTPDTRKYTVDEYGTRKRVQNVPIPILYPKEADKGLWGGEGFIKGYFKRNDNPLKPRHGKYVPPKLTKRAFYSEILDRWMAITCTMRTLDLVDEAQGFDNYILKTHEVDLKSRLGMRLKHEILLALADQTLHPDNPEKRDLMLEKYKNFIIPREEAEWVGLTMDEAETKVLMEEEEQRIAGRVPLKDVYLDELIQKLKDKTLDDDQKSGSGFLSKLNPFKDSGKEHNK